MCFLPGWLVYFFIRVYSVIAFFFFGCCFSQLSSYFIFRFYFYYFYYFYLFILSLR